MALNKTVQNIRLKREDLSDYLYHFTKNANAFNTLKKILGEGKLRDVGNAGVICFTDAPFPVLINMFDIFRPFYDPMYAPYGVAIKKTSLFEAGARPVIYCSSDERLLID